MSRSETNEPDQNETAPQSEQDIDENSAGADEYFGSDDRLLEMARKLKAAETEVLKSHAEAENFRKRLQRDSEQQLRYANMPLVRDLLDVIDNLKRATDAATGEAGNTTALLDGVQMVTQQLMNTLNKFACQPIQSVGKPFDPNFHEAIAQMPSQEVPSGSVLQEVAVGYTLHDRVIRPSQVIVSTGPAAQ